MVNYPISPLNGGCEIRIKSTNFLYTIMCLPKSQGETCQDACE